MDWGRRGADLAPGRCGAGIVHPCEGSAQAAFAGLGTLNPARESRRNLLKTLGY